MKNLEDSEDQRLLSHPTIGLDRFTEGPSEEFARRGFLWLMTWGHARMLKPVRPNIWGLCTWGTQRKLECILPRVLWGLPKRAAGHNPLGCFPRSGVPYSHYPRDPNSPM